MAAATFSSRCATDEVPGMGNIADECPRSQASATCKGVASWRVPRPGSPFLYADQEH